MNKKERQILNIIKYSPSIFIILLSSVLTFFSYLDSKKTYLNEKNQIEEKYTSENKNTIKQEVNKAYSFIVKLQNLTEEELKSSIKSRVYEAHTIANAIYEKYKNSKSKEEIIQIIKTSLKDLRFNNNRGYFFIVDNNAISILQPSLKDFENKNLLEYTDFRGYQFMKSIVKTINEKSERFDEYYWKNPNSSNESSKKISFYKSFESLNIAIGSGEYVEEFENETKKKALEYIKLTHFGKSGYIFIVDYKGIYLNHIRPEYIGKDASTNNDTVNIKKIISDLIEISKNGEGFYTYIQNKKPNTDLPTKKISYVKGLNNWEWMIGTGFYEDELNEVLKEKKKQIDKKFEMFVENIFIISIFLNLILLLISKYISKFLENKFNAYKKEIEKKQAILYQQSKMAAMGEMIGNIAHQWRQPLSTITAASSGVLVSKNLGILEDSLLENSLTKITSSAQYLSKTIDDFRNFFNPDKIKNVFLLKNTMKTTLELVSAQFNSQNIIIIEKIEDVKIDSYENELIQALINILNNARDEFKNKEKDLNKKLIFIDIYKQNENLIIKIKDNAGGVKVENIDKIFKPYFTTKKELQGTGIGLYMTEEIIIAHLNGTIKVENKDFLYDNVQYKGAEFKITIPFS